MVSLPAFEVERRFHPIFARQSAQRDPVPQITTREQCVSRGEKCIGAGYIRFTSMMKGWMICELGKRIENKAFF